MFTSVHFVNLLLTDWW